MTFGCTSPSLSETRPGPGGPPPAVTGVTAERISLPRADGAPQNILYEAPSHAHGTLIMLPGGSGRLGLAPDGSARRGDNILVRTRALWLSRGYAVLIPDAPAGTSLRGVRHTPAYAATIDSLIDFARRTLTGPVFLIGTSQGSIAAVNGAAHARPGTVAGAVLTESVSRMGGSHETVFDADPEAVHVPVLIVANRQDTCEVAPPEDAPRIAKFLSGSPDVHVLPVDGGVFHSRKACGSLTPHGYDGIETEVVKAIGDWLDAHR